jgi:hypothetical protein
LGIILSMTFKNKNGQIYIFSTAFQHYLYVSFFVKDKNKFKKNQVF